MDIKCALCGEPWDSYHIKNDMDPDDRKLFEAGKGCESCKFGRELPIREGQIFAAEGSDALPGGQAIVVTWPDDHWQQKPPVSGHAKFDNGQKVEVTMVDYEHKCGKRMASFNPLITFKLDGKSPEDGSWNVLADQFRSWFKLVPAPADIERAEQLQLDAAGSAIAASDECPLGILAQRGLD